MKTNETGETNPLICLKRLAKLPCPGGINRNRDFSRIEFPVASVTMPNDDP